MFRITRISQDFQHLIIKIKQEIHNNLPSKWNKCMPT